MLLIGSLVAFSLPLSVSAAGAATPKSRHASSASAASHHASTMLTSRGLAHLQTASYRMAYGRNHGLHGHAAYAMRWGGMSCVPYARSVSGIDVPGNAWQWWDNAAGRYARGSRPEPGSVLSFSANGRMRLGHVAVVSRVVNAREIEVDQANWMRGGVSHGMPVVDVSENNDWTAVRVGLGQSGDFGSVYPTNGFIYARADDGQMVAAVSAPAPQPALNPAPRDLRPYAQRADYSPGFDEVAEAPAPHATAHHHVTHHRYVAQH